ncbi:Zinc finger protein 319 [Liparis tanakae]|uniref:Zinc finger protein 319 n=1 Tax=Liparis tanakae TaxID=230148 RepID=A0A4Z2G7D1_9TELE|nr:Zinc finger protein 319 [Liparis tanakae]
MTEAWQQQHAVAPPSVVHTLPQGADNPLGCTVYGVVLQADASLQQPQHGQQHAVQAQQPSLQCQPEGERPFRCGSCGKSFKRPSDLRQHERTHSEERPFQCEECQMSFKQQYALVRHRRTHKNPADRPFKCNLCDKGFLQPSHLLYHQQVHGMESLFKCASCQKSFSQSGELLRHKCGGEAEKPYKCDVCGKGYKKNSTLQRHQNAHCTEKPLKCSLKRPPRRFGPLASRRNTWIKK